MCDRDRDVKVSVECFLLYISQAASCVNSLPEKSNVPALAG